MARVIDYRLRLGNNERTGASIDRPSEGRRKEEAHPCHWHSGIHKYTHSQVNNTKQTKQANKQTNKNEKSTPSWRRLCTGMTDSFFFYPLSFNPLHARTIIWALVLVVEKSFALFCATNYYHYLLDARV